MQKEINFSSAREDLVIGRNPVLELLASNRPVECVYIQKGLTGAIAKITALAKKREIPIKESLAPALDRLCNTSSHQGIVAQVAVADYTSVDDIFARAEALGQPPFIIVADGIEDPHNLGAVIRTAEACGAHGLIIPKRRSAGLTFTVAKTSAGAVAHLPVARVGNIASTIADLKDRGLWIYASDTVGERWCSLDYAPAVALVIGAEGDGISRLVKEKCDFTVSIPMCGKINSLNVSVATGIICFEIARQRLNIPYFPATLQ